MTETLAEEPIKPIKELGSKIFLIPDYQRGYKWESKHVRDLLEDVLEFQNRPDKEDDEFYCIQPLVVKEIQSESNTIKYEVIDGQQRLSTIYLILKYLNQEIFKIEYGTRGEPTKFLNNQKDAAKEEAKTDADRFHLYNAWVTIKDWFENTAKDKTAGFEETLLHKVKFIWYEVGGEMHDVQTHFDRLNAGKILLNSAELIKASLFLAFKADAAKLQEMSLEWDFMERQLRQNDFWYFLQNNPQPDSCISLLFEIVLAKTDNKSQPTALYDAFASVSKQEGSEALWKKAKACFYRLQGWFSNREIYHYLGYLVARKGTTETVANYYQTCYLAEQAKSKKELIKHLENKINIKHFLENMSKWNYKDNRNEIQNLLLLFNTLTVLGKKPTKPDTKPATLDNQGLVGYFPFALYKTQKWSIEHILPQKQDEKEENWSNSHWELWRELVKKETEVEDETVEQIFEKKDILAASQHLYGTDIHALGNLALLKSVDNTKLSNMSFESKRKKIIEIDQNGGFIPPCTRNVFLKYYSQEYGQTFFWTGEDSDNYLKAIQTKLEAYLEPETKSDNA